ncbi:BspA family leucine-rich repeat surface protein [Lacticaseibacillus daqingensis]|uniref:BspA family leucine-rich repeat surface protein n=1 Tax=Lacticaseibacillus daqingensis TaxID=2486014 RepID=UPI000F7774B5|nr:BspA family leucine-rich repeat surface protein [Lacticaseibacillus daqingensis]
MTDRSTRKGRLSTKLALTVLISTVTLSGALPAVTLAETTPDQTTQPAKTPALTIEDATSGSLTEVAPTQPEAQPETDAAPETEAQPDEATPEEAVTTPEGENETEAEDSTLTETPSTTPTDQATPDATVADEAASAEDDTTTAPISDTWGTVDWTIADGTLTLNSGEGASVGGQSPWQDYAAEIQRVVIQGTVQLPSSSYELFKGLNKVTAYTGLEKFDLSQVWDMDSMFAENTQLTTLDLSSWDVSGVGDMQRMFNGAGLSQLDLSDWQTGPLSYVQSAFANMPNLTHLDIRGWNTREAYSRSEFTAGSNQLAEIVLGDDTIVFGVTTPGGKVWQGENPDNQFKDSYEGGAGDRYTLIREAVSENGQWGTVDWTLEDGVLTLNSGKGEDAYGTSPWDKFAGAIDQVVIQGTVQLPESCYGLFKGFTDVTIYIGLSNLDTSHVTDMDGMFAGNAKVTSLDLANWDVSQVTWLANMFAGCKALTSATVENWTPKRLEYANNMFDGAGLSRLDLSNWKVGALSEVQYAFANMPNLTYLDISGWDTRYATFSTGIVASSDQLTELVLGDNTFLSDIATPDGKAWTGAQTGHQFVGLYRGGNPDHYTLAPVQDQEGKWGTVSWDIDDDGVLTLQAGVGVNTFHDAPWAKFAADITKVVFAGKVTLPKCINGLFANLSRVTSYDVANVDASRVTHMSETFSGNHAVTSLDLSAWQTGKVVYAMDTFENMANLTDLNIAGLDTTHTISPTMVYNVPKLESLTLGDKTRLIIYSDTNWKGQKTGYLFDTSYGGGYADTYTRTDEETMSVEVSFHDTTHDRVYEHYYAFVNIKPGQTTVDVNPAQLPDGYEAVDSLTLNADDLLADRGSVGDVPANMLKIKQIPKTTTRTITFEGLPANLALKDEVQTVEWHWDWVFNEDDEEELVPVMGSRAQEVPRNPLLYTPAATNAAYAAYEVKEIPGYTASVTTVAAHSLSDAHELTSLPENLTYTVTYTKNDASTDGSGSQGGATGSTTGQTGTTTDGKNLPQTGGAMMSSLTMLGLGLLGLLGFKTRKRQD